MPGGCSVGGERWREAWVRPLTGIDQRFLAEAREVMAPAERTTALLARCVTRIGPVEPVTPDVARSLTLGDRESLLLHLRRATMGEVIQCVVTCPRVGCGELLDVEIRVADLLVQEYPDVLEHHDVTVVDGEVSYRVRFRLPTGGDQEAAALEVDVEAGVATLLDRCVEAVEAESGSPGPLTPSMVAQLEQAMAQLDPQAKIELCLTCPACGGEFRAAFEVGEYLARECNSDGGRLDREVHALAMAYHWAEAEILALTPARRGRYLELVSDALGDGERR
jgi:hypothetical protein